MYIKLTFDDGATANLVRGQLIYNAQFNLYCHKWTAADRLLDKYLKANYKLSLRDACDLLLLRAKVSQGQPNEILITFVDRRLDKLASVITYGTGKIPGSNILKEAFL